MAATLSLCSLTPKLSITQTPSPFSHSRTHLSFLSRSLSSLTLASRKPPALSFTAKSTDTADAVSVIEPETAAALSVIEPETESPDPENVPEIETVEPKRGEVFAVVMVGSRQYIVFPGRYLYVQRLKDASVNDKITLNKVLLVGTKDTTWIGKPIVANATVEAIVEEQTLDKKVIVFKYKRKKNYRRNIGHRQPITRIRITSIAGYEDSPCVTLSDITP